MKEELKQGTDIELTLAPEPFDVDVKRFYIPGASVSAKCPHCGARVTHSYEQNYLSYPKAGEPFVEHLYHEGPNGESHEFTVPLVLNITLAVSP